jgi:hypothetical protein
LPLPRPPLPLKRRPLNRVLSSLRPRRKRLLRLPHNRHRLVRPLVAVSRRNSERRSLIMRWPDVSDAQFNSLCLFCLLLVAVPHGVCSSIDSISNCIKYSSSCPGAY